MGKKIDMTGWIMSEHGVSDSRLTVLYEVEPHYTSGGNRQVQYLCRCSCGKELVVKAGALRTGNTKSCGCYNKELITKRNIANATPIEVGDIFGKLIVLKDLGMRKQKSRDKNWRWSLCQCSCGSDPIEVPNNLLLTGHKKSCGCINSLGEEKIKQILIANNIQFIQEYSFDDLISPKGKKYRFDFAIFKNNQLEYLLEFDGRQHYTGPEAVWTSTRSLEEIQQADQAKNNYCKEKGYTLKRIPYYNISLISLDNILSDMFNIN